MDPWASLLARWQQFSDRLCNGYQLFLIKLASLSPDSLPLKQFSEWGAGWPFADGRWIIALKIEHYYLNSWATDITALSSCETTQKVNMHDYDGIFNSIKAAGNLCASTVGMTHPRTGVYKYLVSKQGHSNREHPSVFSTCPATAALETSLPCLLGANCNTQPLLVVPPTPTISSTALTSKLPSPTSWAPLSTVGVRKPSVSPPAARHPMWYPDPARGLATTRGFQCPTDPVRQLSQDLWALVPGASSLLVVATQPWALDPTVS